MADVVGPLIEIVNCLSTPTCNYVDHYRKFDGDVNVLRDKLEDLNRRKQDIESRLQVEVHVEKVVKEVQVEVHVEKVVKEEVQLWIKRVQTINNEVRDILEKAQRVKWYRKACLGKHVRRKFDEVKEIHEQGSFTGSLVIDPIKERIWEYLMGDEVGMIGICGIGGVGKTTIMKHVHNDLSTGSIFQKVIWVTVSYPFNVFEVQEKIALAIGKSETLEKVEETMRAAALMKIMGEVRFVLILDDVWEKFSLNDVGIPEPVQNKSKVVITTRSIEVCKYLGCKIVKVQPLSPEESLNLFLEKVGRDVLQKVSGLEETLKLIVEECDGLPLAIVVIAGSLKGEYDIAEWRNALNELRQCVRSVKCVEDEIFGRLRFSYDRLRSLQIQECFLYCSLFWEDYEFVREELIEEWIDEGLIVIAELGSRQAAYDRGHAILSRLQQNYLLEECVGSGVKMNDVVRDMAIKCIGPGFGYMVKAGMKLTKVPNESVWVRDLKKLSLMANDISKIPAGLSPKCPLLSTLILSCNPKLSEIPNSFFEDMVGLKVLDLSGTGIEALPDSISNLVNLSALRLRRCNRLKYLPSLAKLRGLKKLDLHKAGIEVVPQGMEMWTSLEYLDLFCDNLKELPTGILPNLSLLQFLCVSLEAPATSCCRSFYMQYLNFTFYLKDFKYFVQSEDFRSLTAYMIIVGSDNQDLNTKDICSIIVQRVLLIHDCDIEGESIKLPDNLQDLRIYRCTNLRSSLNKTVLLEKAIELKWCTILDCEKIEWLFDFVAPFSLFCSVLDKLENLELCGLPNLCALVRLEGGPTSLGIFFNLRRLIIRRCPRIRKLFSLELLQALQNLEEIRVRDCQQMEEIIVADASIKFTFPKLRQLYLVDLPQLESICSAKGDASVKFTFPKLRQLYLVNLPQLESICSAKGVMVFDPIEVMVIIRCPNLKNI
ncbi:hypothetical protein SLE2022_318540 [Rubroshorea leprosula]